MVLTELLVIFFLVLVNGVFAMSEMAVVSARKVKLQGEAQAGSRTASAALALIESPQTFLSTVQVGITLIGILAGVYGGATVAGTLESIVSQVPWLAEHSEAISYALVIAVITYLSLIVGELLPKRLALSNPEGIAKMVATPMRFIARIFRPLIAFLDWSTELLLRLIPLSGSKNGEVTEDEIRAVLSQGREAGVIEHQEEVIMRKVLGLDDKPASTIMTPRTEVTWLNIARPENEVLQTIADNPYSFFPASDGSLENLVGILSLQDLTAHLIKQTNVALRDLIRPAVKIPESLSGLQVLERLRDEKSEVALIIDEYGSVSGFLTLHDVMEALVGAIPSSTDEEPEYTIREDGSILVDATMDISELLRLLNLSGSLQEDPYSHSVGGFIMEKLGHVPQTGEKVNCQSFTFEVVDMDRQRIDKVLVVPNLTGFPT